MAEAREGRATGIGGVFFKAKGDPEALRDWYVEHLKLPAPAEGSVMFHWRHDGEPERRELTVWAPFARDTTYFGPGDASWMTNFIVDDLDAILARLAAEGVEIAPEREDYEYGRFAWVFDPEGNRVELWEPPRAT